MLFEAAPIEGVQLVRQQRSVDERGAFARVFCREEFEANGLDPDVSQSSVSLNPRARTLRGMHYQTSPFEEVKLVRVTSGSVFDVVIDLRADSLTYLQHFSLVLTAASGDAIYIPEGCAHGFLTLEDDTEVSYQMNRPHQPGAGRGVRWNDPAFGIPWPAEPALISERDATYADYVTPNGAKTPGGDSGDLKT